MAGFRDHFSGHASTYAAARPGYPEEMFSWLAGLVAEHNFAWDAATGNGQAARALAKYFNLVHASDASAEQVAQADPVEKVRYFVEPAEEPEIEPGSVDLITVAQAAHWFDRDRFYRAADKVLKRGGVLALWCYERCRVNPDIDPVLDRYYCSLDDYWPAERAYVESGYRTFDFPFREIEAPAFEMVGQWSADQMLAYLQSWSATQRCWKSTGVSPVEAMRKELLPVWGDDVRQVVWPVSMRVGFAG